MQGKQTGGFIRALSVALRLLFFFFIAMLYATNWQILLPLVISIITCGKQRQLWDMRLYLSDQKIRAKRLRSRGTSGLKVMKIFVDQMFIRLFFSKKKCKIIFYDKLGGRLFLFLTYVKTHFMIYYEVSPIP